MLIEAHPVEAKPVKLLPGVEVLRIRPHGDLGPEILPAQRPRQLAGAVLEMLKVLAIREQIEHKNSHIRVGIPIPICHLTLLWIGAPRRRGSAPTPPGLFGSREVPACS